MNVYDVLSDLNQAVWIALTVEAMPLFVRVHKKNIFHEKGMPFSITWIINSEYFYFLRLIVITIIIIFNFELQCCTCSQIRSGDIQKNHISYLPSSLLNLRENLSVSDHAA